MTPKTIYFYWGNETMSFLRCMTFKSFRYYHPDWKMVLVRRKNPIKEKFHWPGAIKQDFQRNNIIDCFHLLNDLDIKFEWLEEEYPAIAKLNTSDVHTSDILSWYILGHKGGVVSDTDIIYTASFDYEKFKNTDFGIVCFQNLPRKGYMPVSFMISKPNVICKKIFDTSVKVVNNKQYESAGTPALTKAVGNFNKMVANHKELRITRLPSEIVFPWSEKHNFSAFHRFAFRENKFDSLNDNTIGIHWYAGTTCNQEYNTVYTEETYKNFDTTISSAIGACL